MPPAQITQFDLGANSQAATSSSRDRRLRVVKRQSKPTTQRDVTTIPFVAGLIALLFSGTGVVFSAY